MNLIDLLLGIGVIACAVWASKRGFVTMILVTLSLAAAIALNEQSHRFAGIERFEGYKLGLKKHGIILKRRPKI